MPSIKPDWYCIVNPHAGSGKTMSEWSLAEKRLTALAVPYKTTLTNYKFHAEKLAFLTDIEGVFTDPMDKKTLISEMDIHEAEDLINTGVVGGGMLPKLQNCIEAMKQGVSRVHILDGRLEHCLLLEFFTEKGIGTAILKEALF